MGELSSLAQLGAAGAVIAVVLLFLRHMKEERIQSAVSWTAAREEAAAERMAYQKFLENHMSQNSAALAAVATTMAAQTEALRDLQAHCRVQGENQC